MLAATLVAVLGAGCGGSGDGSGSSGGSSGGSGGSGAPVISSLNGATTPVSFIDTATDVTIEIRGTGFGSAPGSVRFRQGATVATVNPAADQWTSTAIAAVAPTAGFVAGTCSVEVVTLAGTSNAPTCTLIVKPTALNLAQASWGATGATDLPAPRRGHRAASIAATSGGGFVYVVGGNDGVANVAAVHLTTLSAAGAMGTTWTATLALPSARSLHDVAVADAENAPVATTVGYLYVVGGQASASDAPGGTTTVFRGVIDRSTGAVTTWTAATSLPAPRIGARAVVTNGFLHVLGGADASGVPAGTTFSAPVQSDGTLGAFATDATTFVPGRAFHQVASYGDTLLVCMGETGTVTAPYGSSTASPAATALTGKVRAGGIRAGWTATTQGDRVRTRHDMCAAFGRLLVTGGVFSPAINGGEGEATFFSPGSSGQVGQWTVVNVGNQLNRLVFHAASVLAPVRTAGGNPVFFHLGGDLTASPGSPSVTVLRTQFP